MTQSLPPKSLVLYADDDQDDIELITEAFELYQNVKLVTFPDGIEMINYIEKLDSLQPTPCLLIIDINMPRLNGKETLRRIRQMKEFEDVPAVLFTTSTLPADNDFAQRFNAGFVTKPLVFNQVHQIVDQIVDHCTDEVKKMLRKRNGN